LYCIVCFCLILNCDAFEIHLPFYCIMKRSSTVLYFIFIAIVCFFNYISQCICNRSYTALDLKYIFHFLYCKKIFHCIVFQMHLLLYFIHLPFHCIAFTCNCILLAPAILMRMKRYWWWMDGWMYFIGRTSAIGCPINLTLFPALKCLPISRLICLKTRVLNLKICTTYMTVKNKPLLEIY